MDAIGSGGCELPDDPISAFDPAADPGLLIFDFLICSYWDFKSDH